MQATIATISDVEQEANFTVLQDELQPHFELAYEEFRPKVDIKGFRKGRVPLSIIKQMYGQAIEHDALEKVAGTLFRQEMQERKVTPIGRPVIEDMNFKRGEQFTFKIKFEIRPVIEPHGYKGIKIDKIVHPVNDDEIEGEIQRLRRSNSTTEPADRVLDEFYAVTATVQEVDDTGSPLIGRKNDNVRFYLFDPEVLPEVRAALNSAEIGGVYTATVEQKHEDHSQTSNLSLTVSKIEKVILPAMDDELGKKVTGGKTNTLGELRENIRKDVVRYWLDLSNRRLDDDLANEVVRNNEFHVPPSLVESFLEAMLEDVRNRSRDRQLPKGFDETKFRDENRTYALWQSKWMLLKERIADVEAISLEPEDIEQAVERDGANLPISKERLLAHYRTSESARERLQGEKVMAFIRSHATISEKSDFS